MVRADFWHSFRRAEVRRFIVRLCAGYQGALPRLPEIYRSILAPVHAIWGGKERHFPVQHATELTGQVPHSDCTVLSDGYHWLPWSHAEELAAVIEGFARNGARM